MPASAPSTGTLPLQGPPAAADPLAVAACRQYLLRHARLALDAAAAEDVVHDTMLGALVRLEAFQGRAALRTWLLGILRHKIADALRLRGREIRLDDLDVEPNDADGYCAPSPFHAGGEATKRGPWNPESAVSGQRFIVALDAALARLPPPQARVFLLREVHAADTADICAELGVSANHSFVLFHRARSALRAQLEPLGYGAKGPPARSVSAPNLPGDPARP